MKNFLLTLPLIALVAACGDTPPAPVSGEKVSPDGTVKVDPADQDKSLPQNWFNKDAALDGVEGMSVDLAYSSGLVREGVPTITVAVIDSGVDSSHDDLQGRMWVNEGEIAGNGIDDDQNGHIDDVHGWNFLGGVDADGKPVNLEGTTLEVTRESVRMKKLKAEREAQGKTLTPTELAYHDKVTGEVKEAVEDAVADKALYTKLLADLRPQAAPLETALGVKFEAITKAALEKLQSEDGAVNAAKEAFLKAFTDTKARGIPSFLGRLSNAEDSLTYYYNENFEERSNIVGDDESDLSDFLYGNTDYTGADSSHGTHVSGSIAATRDNGIGIDGVARDARIMALRAVPNGDEYDKDVANAVRYAADHGARIINMSFGKQYSPYKEQVDDAFAYAEAKGVLVFHAAGNDAADIDQKDFFPHPRTVHGGTLENWITVGASAARKGKEMVADFSNYGQKNVDLFAPGVEITSTVPGNTYDAFSGTSMASPSAAGVAALVWSQYPQLTALQVRKAMTSTVRKYPGLLIRMPTDGGASRGEGPFENLSNTGGILNAYEALKAAAEIVF